MAQCYARDAANGGLEECLQRLQAYEEVAGVDWVQEERYYTPDMLEKYRRSSGRRAGS